jgi:hypothetical protein
MTLVAGRIGRLRVHARTEKLVTDPLGLANLARSLRPAAAAAGYVLLPIATQSKPHALRRKGRANGFLHVVQDDRANHRDHDCRDTCDDKAGHYRPPFSGSCSG